MWHDASNIYIPFPFLDSQEIADRFFPIISSNREQTYAKYQKSQAGELDNVRNTLSGPKFRWCEIVWLARACVMLALASVRKLWHKEVLFILRQSSSMPVKNTWQQLFALQIFTWKYHQERFTLI